MVGSSQFLTTRKVYNWRQCENDIYRQNRGGSVKTTFVYKLASGALKLGLKVQTIDGDRNIQAA